MTVKQLIKILEGKAGKGFMNKTIQIFDYQEGWNVDIAKVEFFNDKFILRKEEQ